MALLSTRQAAVAVAVILIGAYGLNESLMDGTHKPDPTWETTQWLEAIGVDRDDMRVYKVGGGDRGIRFPYNGEMCEVPIDFTGSHFTETIKCITPTPKVTEPMQPTTTLRPANGADARENAAAILADRNISRQAQRYGLDRVLGRSFS